MAETALKILKYYPERVDGGKLLCLNQEKMQMEKLNILLPE